MNNFALQLRELIDDTSHCSMVFYVNIFMFDDVQRMTNTSLLMILLVESNYWVIIAQWANKNSLQYGRENHSFCIEIKIRIISWWYKTIPILVKY